MWLEFGEDAQNLKLGDVIKVDRTSYLVVRISGKYEYVSGTQTTMTQEVVAIPLYTTSSTTTNVIAIPWALPEVTVREAHPQLAFVVENLDPKNGRGAQIALICENADGKWVAESYSPGVRGTADWTEVELVTNHAIPPGTVRCGILAYCTPKSMGKAFFDDLQVMPYEKYEAWYGKVGK